MFTRWGWMRCAHQTETLGFSSCPATGGYTVSQWISDAFIIFSVYKQIGKDPSIWILEDSWNYSYSSVILRGWRTRGYSHILLMIICSFYLNTWGNAGACPLSQFVLMVNLLSFLCTPLRINYLLQIMNIFTLWLGVSHLQI